jgi:exportin-2 (importin alpha re-exporter)
MVCKAFSVLTVIVKIERHAQLFADPTALNTMCERIALPNIAIRSKEVISKSTQTDLTCILL